MLLDELSHAPQVLSPPFHPGVIVHSVWEDGQLLLLRACGGMVQAHHLSGRNDFILTQCDTRNIEAKSVSGSTLLKTPNGKGEKDTGNFQEHSSAYLVQHRRLGHAEKRQQPRIYVLRRLIQC
jgi:hypothetical protein